MICFFLKICVFSFNLQILCFWPSFSYQPYTHVDPLTFFSVFLYNNSWEMVLFTVSLRLFCAYRFSIWMVSDWCFQSVKSTYSRSQLHMDYPLVFPCYFMYLIHYTLVYYSCNAIHFVMVYILRKCNGYGWETCFQMQFATACTGLYTFSKAAKFVNS